MTADPADVEVLVGGDVSKGEHHATAVDAAGQTLLSRTVANDQAALEALLDAAGEHGTPALVIDQPGSIRLDRRAGAGGGPPARRGGGLPCRGW